MAQARAPRVGTTPNASKKKSNAQGLVVGFDGQEWTMYTDAISPKDVVDMRRATGLTTNDVFQSIMSKQVPLDVMAALVFLARRQSEGSWISFDVATDGLTLGSDCKLEPEEADPTGEA